jgi:hypothetical protein
VATILLGSAAAASAGDREWYLGAKIDSTSVTVTIDCPSAYYCDYRTGQTETGYELRGGLRLGPHLAVDFGYQRASGLKFTEPSTTFADLPGIYDSQVVFDASVAHASVTGIMPFYEIFEVYGRGGVGLYGLSGEQSLTDVTGGPSLSRSVSKHGTGFSLGFGVGATVAKSWHLSLESESVFIAQSFLGVTGAESASLDTIALGVERRFGRNRRGAGEGL